LAPDECLDGGIDPEALGIARPSCASSATFLFRSRNTRAINFSAVFATAADAATGANAVSLRRFADALVEPFSEETDDVLQQTGVKVKPLRVETQEAAARGIEQTLTFKAKTKNEVEGMGGAVTMDLVVLRHGQRATVLILAGPSLPASELQRLVARIEGRMIGRELVPPKTPKTTNTERERKDYRIWHDAFAAEARTYIATLKEQQQLLRDVQAPAPDLKALAPRTARLSRRWEHMADYVAGMPAPTSAYGRTNAELEAGFRVLSDGFLDWQRGFEQGDEALAAEGDRKIQRGTRIVQQALVRPSRIASRLGENF
jgi:hypothetical protein